MAVTWIWPGTTGPGPLTLALACLAAFAGQAHVVEGNRTRTLILAPAEDGVIVYLKSPAPLLFSDVIRATPPGADLTSPFLYPADGALRYRISREAINRKAPLFRARLDGAFRWSQGGAPLEAQLIGFRISETLADIPFETPEVAEQALTAASDSADPDFGEAAILAAWKLTLPDPSGPLALDPGYPPLILPLGVEIDNHMIDARRRIAAENTGP